MMTPALLLIVLAYIPSILARCPNSCSGHGSCGSSNLCTCYPQWNGGAADCSQRVCPSGAAWADKAYAADFAHQDTECSNAGICDRTSGTCQCFAGFTGSACQRSTCPNDCSGHGVCSTIGDVALYDGPDYDSTMTFAGDGLGPAYTNWDKNSIQLCECEQGFFGADCSLAMCPKGDDPLTINQNYRSIKLRVESTGSYDLEGKLGLQFMGATVILTLIGTSSTQCTDEIAFHGNFGHVSCSLVKIDRLTFDYYLTFYSWPTFPKTNNFYSHDGNPSKYDFYCDLTLVSGFSTCVFTDIETTNIQEYAYCSNRGLCNFDTGDCACNDGFGGPACSNATYMHIHGSNVLPGMQVNVNSLEYTSSALQITTAKSKASDFNLIEAIAGGETVFYVRGDGTVAINKLLTLSGGQTVSGGGLFVEEGGVTIASIGLKVFSAGDSDPTTLISSTYAGALGSAYSALRIKLQTSTPSQARAIEVLHQGQRRFAVRGDGNVLVYQGGVGVTGGITVYTGGLLVTGGTTVSSGGLKVLKSGATITGGTTIYTDGLRVMLGGFEVYSGGASIYSGGLKVIGGQTIDSGGFSVTGGITVGTMGVKVTGGITIYTRGLTVKTQGVSIESGGLFITTGGVTVMNHGMKLTGGISIVAGGITINNGVTVTTGGVVITTSGLTITSGGLSVTAGGIVATGGLSIGSSGAVISLDGLTITAGGFTVAGGTTVSSGGLYVTQSGLTVLAGGLSVTAGGLTVEAGGLSVVANGLSVAGGGITSTGGLTVGSSGLTVLLNGGTITSGGFTVAGGVTVSTGGILVTQDGVTITNGGVSVTAGGLTITNGGLSITQVGLSVAGGGIASTGGLTIGNSGLTVLLNGGTITSGGFTVAGGVTVSTGGILVTQDGVTITNGGVSVTAGGLTITNGGLSVTAVGLSVAAGGVRATGGLTVDSDGLVVTQDGLTVTAGGVSIADGVTISTGGLYVAADGLTVNAGGATVEGGLSITTGGLSVEDTGVFIKAGGLQVTAGATVHTGGLVVGGGMTVAGGAQLFSGVTVYGNLQVSDTITTFASDRRLKRDIIPINDALSKVNRLNGVYFKWIQDEPNGIQFDEARHVGVIAQEVQSVLPEVVTDIYEGKYLGVDYASMIPLVIEALRELDVLFQEGKITAEQREAHSQAMFRQIQGDMKALEERVARIESDLVAVRALLSAR